MSLATGLQEARLTRAYAMLTQTHGGILSIGEIAFRCGFLDHATFTRMFRRRYGMTPSELRAAATLITAARRMAGVSKRPQKQLKSPANT